MKTESTAVFRLHLIVAVQLLCLFSASLAHAQACVEPPPGMVNWWPGDGDARDLVGSQPGTLLNGATFGAGFVGEAFEFDGVDDYVDMEDPIVDGFTQLTIEGWVKRGSKTTQQTIAGIHLYQAVGPGTPANDIGLYYSSNDEIRFSVSTDSAGRKVVSSSPGKITVGEWTHLAGTYDGSTIRLYLSGVLIAEDSHSGVLQATLSFRIGYEHSNEGLFLDGAVDELTVYDRALDPLELQAIVDAGSAGKCKPGRYLLQITDSSGPVGGSADVRILLDSASGSDILGWGFGVCHEFTELVLDGITTGQTTLIVNGGRPPDFAIVDILPGQGWTSQVTIDDEGVNTLPATTGEPYELYVVTYDLVADPGALSTVSFCDTLGTPPVNTVVVAEGTEIVPEQQGSEIAIFLAGECPPMNLVVVLNTGWDQGAGLTIPQGQPDDEWLCTWDRNLNGNPSAIPFNTTLEPETAEVQAPAGGSLTNSEWVYHGTNQSGFYDYQFDFCLNQDFTSAQLDLDGFAATNAEVYLNGYFLGTIPGPSGTPTHISTSVQGYFHPGMNFLKVVVAGEEGQPTGFNLIGTVTANNGQCCCTPAPLGLVGWWPLDSDASPGTAEDLAKKNDGIYQGTAGPNYPPLMVDESILLSGNDTVQVPNNSDVNFGPAIGPGMGDFSIDAWINAQNWDSVLNPIVSKMGTQGCVPLLPLSKGGYTFYIYECKELRLELYDGNAIQSYSSAIGGATFNTNQWYHVAVTVDRDLGSAGVKFYLDGQRIDDGTLDPTGQPGSLFNDCPLFIGHALSSGVHSLAPFYFSGNIDEVEIFDRVLSGGEIRDVFLAETSGKCKEVCHVKWDEPVASGGTATVQATVCNHTTTPQSYTVSANGLPPGPGCDLTPSGVTVSPTTVTSLAPGACATVNVTVTVPSGSLNEVSCYEVIFQNAVTGYRFGCRGSVQIKNLVIVGPTDDDVSSFPDELLSPIILTFDITNPTTKPIQAETKVVAMPSPMNEALRGVISLNGQPPGSSVTGMLSLGGQEGTTIEVEVEFLEHEPFYFFDLILYADTDMDGVFQSSNALISHGLRMILAPANDHCASATLVSEGLFSFDSAGADTEVDQPCSDDEAGDVWFLYTPSASGTLTASTCDSAAGTQDTIVSVYDGDTCPPDAGRLLGCSDDAGCGPSGFLSELSVSVAQGSSYVLQVSTADDSGAGTLSLSLDSDGGGSLARGDCDGNNTFNGLNDALAAINFQFVPGTEAPPCFAACDADGNRIFNGLSDGLYMLNFQFVGGPPPPAPFPECGVDSNGIASLGCDNPPAGCNP